MAGAASSGHTLLVEDHEGVRTLTFNRPEVHNALTGAMRADLCALLAESDQDPQVRAVVLTGTDPAFCAGVDIRDVDPAFDRYRAQFALNPGRALRAMRTPVVAAVNGACVSGGLEIALSSSFVVASERARFADTHARLGVVATWGLTALLPRAVGVRMAREMSVTGRFLDAADALRVGLVNHVVPHDEVVPLARSLAREVAPSAATATVLSLYARGQDLPLHSALALEAAGAADGAFDKDAFVQAGRDEAARRKAPTTPG